MRNKLSTSTVVLIILLLSSFYFSLASGSTVEIDMVSVVSNVIDGDTFDLSSCERIRLADVDSPETYESGYFEATNYITSLIDGKTVYLDIDDISRTDPYGRLICVVYVDYNSTYYENVNKALLVENHAVLYDFKNNEFNPSEWVLFVSKNSNSSPTVSPTPTATLEPTQTANQGNNQNNSFLSTPEFTIVVTAIFLLVLGSIIGMAFRRRR